MIICVCAEKGRRLLKQRNNYQCKRGDLMAQLLDAAFRTFLTKTKVCVVHWLHSPTSLKQLNESIKSGS